MNLKTLINNILFEESDPEKVANRLNILVSNKISLKDIDNLLNSLKNQIKNNTTLFPAGKYETFNFNNPKDLNKYINLILSFIKFNKTNNKFERCAKLKTWYFSDSFSINPKNNIFN